MQNLSCTIKQPRLRGRVQRVLEYASVFSDVKSIRTYRKLLYAPDKLPATVELAIRSLGGNRVICRNRTADVETLWDTFCGRYHLPRQRLNKPACIVDLGANVGYTVAHFAHLYPTAQILAVEMDRSNFDLCLRNTARLGSRVAIVHAAVWSENGFVHYGGYEANGYAVNRDSKVDIERGVTSRTLRSLFDAYHIRKIDFLKMDIEGAEAEVLLDVGEWGGLVEEIGVEIHPPASYEHSRRLLEASGFFCEASTRRAGALVGRRLPG